LFLPLAEGKRRTRTLPSGHQPLALSRGYYACTPLQTAMGALRAIPPGLPQSLWVRGIVGAHHLAMKDELADRADRRAVDDLSRNLQKARPRLFEVGEIVLLHRGKDTRVGHKLRGRGKGPWKVAKVLNDAVELKDAFTGRDLLDDLTHLPDKINVDRLLRFAGSAEHLEIMDMEDQLTLSNARAGGHVAFVNDGKVLLLKVAKVEEEETITGNPMYVPYEERYGATSRRPWKLDDEQQLVVLWRDILCLVDLDETGCLTQGSVERLRRLGLEVTGDPQTN